MLQFPQWLIVFVEDFVIFIVSDNIFPDQCVIDHGRCHSSLHFLHFVFALQNTDDILSIYGVVYIHSNVRKIKFKTNFSKYILLFIIM